MNYIKIIFLNLLVFSSVSSLLAQKNQEKGYIITQAGEKIEGYLKWTSKKRFKSSLFFKENKNATYQEYKATDLKEFGIPQKSQYNSLIYLTEGSNNEFARLIAKDEDFRYFESIEKLPKIYLQKSDNTVEEVPSEFEKINLEAYRVKDHRVEDHDYYDLTNNDLISVPTKHGGFKKGKRKFLFDGELYELQRTYLPFFEKLNNGPLEKFNDPLDAKIVRHYSKKIADNKGQSWQAFDTKPQIQVAILAFFSPLTSIRDEQYVFEYGLMAELRDNTISPNWSISLGFSVYDQYQFTTNEIRCNDFPAIGEICDLSANPIFILGHANAFHLGAAYHFRAGKNLRPYLLARFNRQQIKKALDTSVTDQTFGFPVTKVYEARNESNLRENIGIGIDYYLGGLHQFRVEGLYNRGPEVRIGYGFYFD